MLCTKSSSDVQTKQFQGTLSQLGGITTDIGDLHYCITPTIMFNLLMELVSG